MQLYIITKIKHSVPSCTSISETSQLGHLHWRLYSSQKWPNNFTYFALFFAVNFMYNVHGQSSIKSNFRTFFRFPFFVFALAYCCWSMVTLLLARNSIMSQSCCKYTHTYKSMYIYLWVCRVLMVTFIKSFFVARRLIFIEACMERWRIKLDLLSILLSIKIWSL